MSDEIRFEDIKLSLLALWKRKVLITACSVLVFLVGLLLTLGVYTENTYSATATVYSAFYGSYKESEDAATAMISYADIVSSNKVCERAASLLGSSRVDAQDIQGMIGVSTSGSSVVMSIYAYSTDYQLSISVANAVAEAFVIEISSITGSDAIRVLDEATQVRLQDNGVKNLWMLRLLFPVAGFGLCCAYFFLKELFSDKIRTIEQCTEVNDKIVGIIPLMEEGNGKGMVI